MAQARLIEDLLDTSRMVAGKLRIETRRVDLAEILDRIVEGIRPDAERKRIALEMTMDTGAAVIAADPDRLRVFGNIVANE